jgi:Cu/Zn superoxide dismutase
MSSDPTQPTPEWWQQPKPRGDQGNQGNQGYSGNQGYPETPDYPGYQGNQGGQGPQGTQRFEANQGYPAAQAYQGPPARYRRRRRRWPLVTLIVIVLILVVADRAANAFTEDQMASQVQSSLELSGKPHVSIQGFPFLTQLAARDFKTVDITASNETAGTGGQLEIESLNATLHGMHIHGLNSATIDQFNATALINFTALAKAGGIPQGITLSADGPNRVKANISIGPLSDTAVAQVTQSGAGQINVKIIDAGGIPTSVLGSLADFSVSIPKLPAGVSIQSVSVTQQGVLITANGHNTTLSQ